jgi:hypothetical protein
VCFLYFIFLSSLSLISRARCLVSFCLFESLYFLSSYSSIHTLYAFSYLPSVLFYT